MVNLKHKAAVLFLSVLIFGLLVIASCNIDVMGSFSSSDLDERLLEKDNFKFLSGETTDRAADWTTALSSLPNEYSFIVVTDTHLEEGDAFGFEKLPSVIESYNGSTATPKIEFVVVLGDITQFGTEQDIKLFMDIAEDTKNGGIPYYPVIGNHDFYFGNWPAWKGLIGSTSYRINAGDKATLFILDSANSFFGKQQLDWLESELYSAKGHVFVFTHSPLFVDGPIGMQQVTDKRERARIISILDNKCDIMFMGHMHKRREDEINGVRYVTTEDFRSKNIYCIVTVKSSGITYEFKKL
jgi:3',5'-cyclic AMP phosphodiesterase CpdA